MTRSSRTLLVILLAILPSLASALDLKLSGFSCNETLPVYATAFDMSCDDNARCTMGEMANLFGTMMYDGVQDTGIQDYTAYLSADMTFMTLHYDLLDYYQFDLCYEGVISEVDGTVEGGDATDTSSSFTENPYQGCPNDGEYGFDITYTLPSADEMSWLATGFTGHGDLYMYADQNQENIIGYCQFSLVPLVTPDSSKAYNMPSAKVTGISLLALLGLLLVTVFYCTCCRGRRGRKAQDDEATSFVRMQDADKQNAAVSTKPGVVV